MNKQYDIFSGATLNAYDKHELKKEQKENSIKGIFGDFVQFTDGDKKVKIKEVCDRDFIRTSDDVFQVKYKMRNYYVSTSIVSNKEVWVERNTVKEVSDVFLDVLKEQDKVLVINDNGILIEGLIVGFIAKKKNINKIVVEDVKDKEVLIFEKTQIKKVLKLKEEKECRK